MILLPKSRLSHIWDELKKDYMEYIASFLEEEWKAWKIIYPKKQDVFNAFKYTDFDDVQVVILGQDPYHGAWQAHGLSFSVLDWVKVPPSLRNIYKEIDNQWFSSSHNDGSKGELSWNLEHWAKQWVLLLNSVLTVEAWKPASHSKIWWQQFTDRVISILSEKKRHVVFLLWGKYAQSKSKLIDPNHHLILQAAHPSPLARNAFSGCSHFSKTNDYLCSHNIKPIEWKLPQ